MRPRPRPRPRRSTWVHTPRDVQKVRSPVVHPARIASFNIAINREEKERGNTHPKPVGADDHMAIVSGSTSNISFVCIIDGCTPLAEAASMNACKSFAAAWLPPPCPTELCGCCPENPPNGIGIWSINRSSSEYAPPCAKPCAVTGGDAGLVGGCVPSDNDENHMFDGCTDPEDVDVVDPVMAKLTCPCRGSRPRSLV